MNDHPTPQNSIPHQKFADYPDLPSTTAGAAPAGEEKGGGVSPSYNCGKCNIQFTPGGPMICFGEHERHEPCEWHKLVVGSHGAASDRPWKGYVHEVEILRNAVEALRLQLESANAEIARLKAGQFTKEEIHNICHNLHGTVSVEEFAEGCRKEMVKLYGRCPMLAPEEALPPGWLGAPKSEWDRLEAKVKEAEQRISPQDIELCRDLLVAIAGIHPTPVEGYNGNISWAVRDTVACLRTLRQDRNDAAGELGIDIKEMPPGSTLAKCVVANVLLRKSNQNLLNQLSPKIELDKNACVVRHPTSDDLQEGFTPQ
jgi:hypothetical protein